MRRLVLMFTAVIITACAREPAAPRAGITLLVTNASCASGPCDSLRILAFPSNGPVTPGGLWSLSLGMMTTSQACFVFPAAASARGVTWTTAVPVSLGANAPSTGLLFASPTTTAFIPADAAGWSITLPTDTIPTPSSACKP